MPSATFCSRPPTLDMHRDVSKGVGGVYTNGGKCLSRPKGLQIMSRFGSEFCSIRRIMVVAFSFVGLCYVLVTVHLIGELHEQLAQHSAVYRDSVLLLTGHSATQQQLPTSQDQASPA